MEDYDLEWAGDLILAERAAMCLARIARAEAYDARVADARLATLLGALRLC